MMSFKIIFTVVFSVLFLKSAALMNYRKEFKQLDGFVISTDLLEKGEESREGT